jgi:DNA-binding NarL/FixJ family response regulator
MKIRVLIADDHRIIREGLCSLLAEEEDIQVVGQAGDGVSCLTEAEKSNPNVIIMDINMPQMNGLLAIRRLVKECPRARILGLSMQTDRSLVLEALHAGAAGFLSKDCAYDELARAIRAVHGGHSYLSPALTGVLVNDCVRRRSSAETHEMAPDLSPREKEVLQMIADGLTSKEAADKLQISTKTIESHRHNIMNKVGLHSVAELTKYAVQEGLSELNVTGR